MPRIPLRIPLPYLAHLVLGRHRNQTRLDRSICTTVHYGHIGACLLAENQFILTRIDVVLKMVCGGNNVVFDEAGPHLPGIHWLIDRVAALIGL